MKTRIPEEVYNRLLYAASRQLLLLWLGMRAREDNGSAPPEKRLRWARLHRTLPSESKLTPRHFYNGLLEQLGCETRFYRGDARNLLHHEIEIMRGVGHRKLVVIVDEGHLLSKEMLEEIRFLLNYKMDSENPLALILAGQTELWEKLRLQAYRAILHRVDIQCFLMPYEYAQTKAYIEKQLTYAGHSNAIFSEDAMKAVHSFSSGILRLINRACTQSLVYAYQNRRAIIDDRMGTTRPGGRGFLNTGKKGWLEPSPISRDKTHRRRTMMSGDEKTNPLFFNKNEAVCDN